MFTNKNFVSTPVLVILGIGNPGQQYKDTRHNAGFWFLDLLSEELSIAFKRVNKSIQVGFGEINQKPIVLAKSRTFINESGIPTKYLLNRFSIQLSQLLVVYDDIHLPVGKLRLRASGSAGGHNGIRSIISSIQSEDFARIRIGVGSPDDSENQIEYVLGEPNLEEKEKIISSISSANQLVETIIEHGLIKAMSDFN